MLIQNTLSSGSFMLTDLQIYITCLLPHGLGRHVGRIRSASVSCLMCTAKNDLQLSTFQNVWRRKGARPAEVTGQCREEEEEQVCSWE